MTLKQFLSQPPTLKAAVYSVAEQMDELNRIGVMSRSYTGGMVKNERQRSQVERIAENLFTARQTLQNKIEEYTAQSEQVRELIWHVPDAMSRTLLEKRYILGETWEDAAEECFISLRAAHYLHKKAIATMKPLYRQMGYLDDDDDDDTDADLPLS